MYNATTFPRDGTCTNHIFCSLGPLDGLKVRYIVSRRELEERKSGLSGLMTMRDSIGMNKGRRV